MEQAQGMAKSRSSASVSQPTTSSTPTSAPTQNLRHKAMTKELLDNLS